MHSEVTLITETVMYSIQICWIKSIVAVADLGVGGGGEWSGLDWAPLGVQCPLFVWALSNLLEQTILVNKVYDELDTNQSLRQGKQRYLEQKKPNSIACFILFMMVVEHWQLQEHMDWHKAINMP